MKDFREPYLLHITGWKICGVASAYWRVFKKAKTKTYKINFAYLTDSKDINLYKIDNEITEVKNSEIPIMDINSTGSIISKKEVDLWALKPIDVNLIDKEEKKVEVKEEEQLSFSDFVEDFKI